MPKHPHIQQLIHCIELEEKEQANRYQLSAQHSLKALKAEGLALHPIVVTRKAFGYADYPEISFKLPFPPETSMFKDGAAIECFMAGEEPVKGILMQLDGKAGEFRLFAPDFPDWIEEHGVSIKLAPDTRTTSILKKVMEQLEQQKHSFQLFKQLHHPEVDIAESTTSTAANIPWRNRDLNASQQQAVTAILQQQTITVVHGPPGTGKTTTLVEAICQLVQAGEKVVVSAPANAAVDHLAKGLIAQGVKLLRVGNTSRVDTLIFTHTPEGKLANSPQEKELKQLKKRADECRRMALKYKRNFGKAEREQRSLLLKEVKDIRTEIKKLQAYYEEKWLAEASVIAGTPIGLYDANLRNIKFTTLVIDEAGQCLEPLAWCIIPLAEKVVLAGDHFQLPPTVLSAEATNLGFNRSILEVAIGSAAPVYLLNIQYRMREVIAGFSSMFFYEGLLQTPESLANNGAHLCFIDTAGSGYEEQQGADGSSLQNEGELLIVQQVMSNEFSPDNQVAFISPYAAQVALAKTLLPAGVRISTIDSFQGQEHEVVIVSLVRSNDDGDIGFLKDYRRMNVALTRAKQQLIVIGDSATLGGDAFYKAFLNYVEQHGVYRSVWEFDITFTA